MNPVWFSTVALVRFLLGRVSDGLRVDGMDGWMVVASESFLKASGPTTLLSPRCLDPFKL